MFFLRNKANSLPEKPGVYIMKDINKNIIYIGKAKILRRRVSQYFINNQKNYEKVRAMVSNISDFDYIITDSEFEALVLECSLIKKYQPKYNILLKDDKGYSYIKITNEDFPRILYVKQKINDSARYFGPYVNSFDIKNLVQEIIDIFKLPTCSRNFSKFKTRPCLDYYINKCIAPCKHEISIKNYNILINEAILFIKNGSKNTIEYLTNEMLKASENLNFEKAADLRDRIKSIKTVVTEKQKVVSNKIKDQDVIALVINQNKVSVQVFRFQDGSLYDSENFLFDFFDNEINLRTEFIKRYYDLKNDIPENLTLDGEIENFDLIKKWIYKTKNKNIKILIPKKGEQFKLVQMCKNNAYEAFNHKYKNQNENLSVLEDLKNLINLKNTPYYIEAYDISNLQGSDNVGGMVVFKNLMPLKSAYRRFKIKTLEHQDDYGSLREILTRRIKNYHKNQNSKNSFSKLPDLILIDGGFAQVSVAQKIFFDQNINIPIFGMVKDDKHRTRALTTNNKIINIKNNIKIFNFITRIQDEVHRFTISYHKNLRNQKAKNSILTDIPGVGEKTSKLLLKKFDSIKNISLASVEELVLIKGINKACAESIKKYFEKSRTC